MALDICSDLGRDRYSPEPLPPALLGIERYCKCFSSCMKDVI